MPTTFLKSCSSALLSVIFYALTYSLSPSRVFSLTGAGLEFAAGVLSAKAVEPSRRSTWLNGSGVGSMKRRTDWSMALNLAAVASNAASEVA